jgi:asparagine synthase (glutamine-hydrolysing)
LPLARQFEIALASARLARRPVWDVFSAMAAHGVLGLREDPLEKIKGRWTLASEEALQLVREMVMGHDWMEIARRSSPARALRIAHIADLQYYHQYSNPNAHFAAAPVLAMTPVVECCLGIAPYTMTQGGERGLARAAFADLLPDEIVKRTTKGATTRYHQAVLEHQLPLVRAMLTDGELVRRGLVAKEALAAAFARGVLADAVQSAGVLTAFIAEMWLQRLRAVRDEVRGAISARDHSHYEIQPPPGPGGA